VLAEGSVGVAAQGHRGDALDMACRSRLIASMILYRPLCRVPHRAALALCLAVAPVCGPLLAMVGGAAPAGPDIAPHVALLVGSRGNSCSGVVIARDAVLTAAHCVLPGADYKLVVFDAAHQPQFKDVATIARHPQFSLATLLAHRATADVALLKLAAPLPPAFAAAPLARADRVVAAGDEFIVAGFGVTVRGDGRTGGAVRAATLVATGEPGALQIRLVDPLTKGERAGRGACSADSGAPAFETDPRHAVIGVVSWSTGPQLSDGCGGLTGITPLARYRGWIVDTAQKMGAAL
jgi:secreted trypsin-like serine protease